MKIRLKIDQAYMKRLLLLSTILSWFGFLNAQTNFIKQDTVFSQSSDCAGGVNICIDSITYNRLDDYNFVLDGQPFSTTFDFCKEGVLHNYPYSPIFQGGYAGPFSLNSWSIDGRTYSIPSFTSLNQLLDSMRVWDPTGGWQLDSVSQLIFGYPQVGRTYSCQSITGSGLPVSICYNEAVFFSGLKFKVPTGFHQLIVTDTTVNQRDTITLGAACVRRDTIRQTMEVGTNRAYCISTSEFLGQPVLSTFTNLCSGVTTHVTFDSLFNFCAGYTARTAGLDSACLKVCDQYGICDTSTLYITAEISPFRNSTIRDTISIGVSRQRCSLTVPTGTLRSYTNLCPTLSGTQISFVVDSAANCVTYTGVAVGLDTACIQVCNTSDVCDTTFFIIEGQNTPILRGGSFTASDTLTIGLSRQKSNFSAPSNPIIFENICLGNSGTNIRFVFDTAAKSVTYTALTVGSDTACVRVCNALGTCDTTIFTVRALVPLGTPATPSVDTVNLKLLQRLTYCPDTMELAGSPVSLIKFCTPSDFDNVEISLDTIRKCAVLSGRSTGIDTFCIAVCNIAGFCDTTTLYAKVAADTVKPTPSFENITLRVGEVKTYCPDTTQLVGGIVNDIRNCTVSVVDNIGVTLNPVIKCVELRGVSSGRDTVCFAVCNTVGLCDTTTLYLRVLSDTVRPVSTLETIDVKLDENFTFSEIDTSEILGVVDTIFDACPGSNGSRALMVLNRAGRSVQVTGLTIGQDRMCIVVCNRASGLCDTTTLVVNVRDTAAVRNLIANNDFDTTRQGRIIDLYVYTNDSLRGRTPTSLVITRPPIFGTADTFSFSRGLIRYKPGSTPYSCGLDSFRYRFCVDTVCAEATVVIEILCRDSLKVYNAISPNKDGRNDALVFDGLQKYPSNTLIIYNRWGNEVYKIKNYQNDWQGTWNSKDLPDGTYFYFLRNDDTGEVILTGALQILR